MHWKKQIIQVIIVNILKENTVLKFPSQIPQMEMHSSCSWYTDGINVKLKKKKAKILYMYENIRANLLNNLQT